MENNAELTFGQKFIGVSFNPSNDEKVSKVKQLCADIVDIIGDPTKDPVTSTWSRNVIRTQAINCVRMASMAAVSFLTWKE